MPEKIKQSIFNKPIFYGFLMFLLSLLILQAFTYQRIQIHKKTEQHHVNKRVLELKDDLHHAMGQSFIANQTLSFIVENYGLPQNYDSIAHLFLDSNEYVDALEIINKEGFITHVYPYKGNEVLGYNVFKDSTAKNDALKRAEKKEYFTTGPKRLKQGGAGFITRTPMYNKDGFAGFAASIIRLSTIINIIESDTIGDKQFSYQLSKVNDDHTEEVFYSSNNISLEHAIHTPITTRHGEWKLYVISNNSLASSTVPFFSILGFIFSLLSGVLVWFITRQPFKLNKLVEEKISLLKESQEKYRTLVEQASDGIIVSNKAGEILDVNETGTAMFGYTKEDFLQKNFNDLVFPEDLAKLPLRYHKITKARPFVSERTMIRKDGSTFISEISSKVLPNNTVQGIVRDISTRKELEKTAQNNLKIFSKAFNNRTIGMAIKDENNCFTDANSYFLSLIGYTIDEIKGKTCAELGLIELNEDLSDKSLSNTKLSIDKMDVDLITKSGETLHLLTSIEQFYYENKTLNLCTYIDRTEAKKANRSLRQSEKEYRQLTERISDAFVAFDKDWNFISINAKAAEIVGMNPSKKIGKNLWVEFPSFANSEAYTVFTGAMKSQEYTYFVQYHPGQDSWIENHLYPSADGLSIYFRDITKRKQAEIEKQKLIAIIKNSPGFVGLATMDGKALYLNDAGRKLVGLSSEEDITGLSITDFFGEEYAEIIVNEHLPTLENNKIWSGEVQFQHFKTKKLIPAEFSGFLIRNEQTNEPIGIGSTGFDLTSRKITEQKILDLQAKMNAAIRIGKIGYWNWDMSTDIVEWSEEMYAIHHIKPNTIMTVEKVKELIYTEDRHILETKLKTKEGEISNSPSIYRILLKDNTFKHILTYSELIYDQNGTPILYQGTAMDITKNILAKEALRQSEVKFAKAFQNNLMGMLIIDSNKKILEANTTVLKLLNTTKIKLIGNTLTESGAIKLNDANNAERDKFWDAFLKEGRLQNNEFKITLINNETLSLLVSIEPIKYNNKENYLVTLVDDTKRKKAEEALEQQNSQLMKTNSELDQFVYSASHELRAPLTSLLGLIDLSKKEKTNPSLRLNLQMMEKSITRLDDFIKDIIEYSRNKHLKVNNDVIDFTKLIENSIETFWYLNNTSKIEMHINVDDNIEFISDSKRISILLNNFISNAIKYHDLDKKSPSIWVNIKTSKKEAIIEIKDNGVGIEEEQLDKIFNMFYRVSSKIMGSGIGLFIVKEVLTKLKGSIKVTSKLGEGSTFTLNLPNESKTKSS